jgi:hypothetical protein
MSKRVEVLCRHIVPQETSGRDKDPARYTQIDRKKLALLLEKEEQMFMDKHPKRHVKSPLGAFGFCIPIFRGSS